MATGQLLRTFSGHTMGVGGVAFSPDGRYVLTGSEGHTARLWGVDCRDFIAYACTRVWRDFTDDERQQLNITGQEPTCPQFDKQAIPVSPVWTPVPTSAIPVWTPPPSLTASPSPSPGPSPTEAPWATETPGPTETPTLTKTPAAAPIPVTLEFTPFPTRTIPAWTPLPSLTPTSGP